jgi:hypothetical protein
MYVYEKRHASSFEGTGRKEMLSCFDNANGDWLLCRSRESKERTRTTLALRLTQRSMKGRGDFPMTTLGFLFKSRPLALTSEAAYHGRVR